MSRRELVLGVHRVAMVVEFDGTGKAVAVRWPCRNPKCCSPQEGKVAVHRREFRGLPDLVGPETRTYEPRKTGAEMARGRPQG